MSRQSSFRISGKSLLFPQPSGEAGWTFSIRPGGWCLALHQDGRRVRFAIAETRTHLGFSIGGRLWHGEVQRAARASAGASSTAGADSDLTAQFPGKVRKVLVVEGAQVAEGDPLVQVEAMKMEFTIKAPVAGRILRILVKEAQQLSPGDRFLEMEPGNGET